MFYDMSRVDMTSPRSSRVYGPVPSRRFGLSLGVDLVPYKTCSYDCVYCQLGRTEQTTLRRQAFFEPEVIAVEVQKALEQGPKPDVVTLAGSGEPTLYAPLGRLVELLRERSATPIVLLTNGGTLFLEDVAEDALVVDVLAPSLDAGDEETFRLVNRPDPEVTFQNMVDGIERFRRRFVGEVRLEVMLVRDLNDSTASITNLEQQIDRIRPPAVDLNTPVRPGASVDAKPCTEEFLSRVARQFGPSARPIAAFPDRLAGRISEQTQSLRRFVMETLSRRPCTVRDLVTTTGVPANEIVKVVDSLIGESIVEERRGKDEAYFWVPQR
jgi:wyosine [tRNA(Phe)-imidazoG37] synthetase (radical SAM superfamily)